VTKDDGLRWFSTRCVIRFGGAAGTYEERITLWRAASFEDAIERAEREVETYAAGLDARALGLVQAFELDAPADLADGIEAFSLMRDSHLGPTEYLERFLSTGDEHQGEIS
jgi:hypothetical protein